MSDEKLGNLIRIFGWIILVYNTLKYAYAIYETLSDASVSAYALLIVFEGIMYIAVGLIVVWIGRRIKAKPPTPKSSTNGKVE